MLFGCGLLFALCPLAAQQETPPTEGAVVRHIQHVLSNLDQEITNCVRHIQNQEQVVESMRQEMNAFTTSSKEQLKAWGKTVEKVLKETKQYRAYVDAKVDGLTEVLQELKKKCQDQEELSRLQSEQIRNLEAALRSIVQAVKPGGSSPGVYEVVSGDTLEKIADRYGTTVRKIKEKNDLKKDTIFPGQKLEIP